MAPGCCPAELAQLRELRLQQMKLEAGAREQLQRHGHGKLNEHQAAAAYVSAPGAAAGVHAAWRPAAAHAVMAAPQPRSSW